MSPRLRRFFESTGAQIIAIPSALSAVSIYFVDVVERPALALVCTVLIIFLAAGWVWWSLKRQERRAMQVRGNEIEEVHRDVDGLVLILSDRQEKYTESTDPAHSDWLESAPGFLVETTEAKVVGLLVTDQASANARSTRAVLERKGLVVHERRLSAAADQGSIQLSDNEETMAELLDRVQRDAEGARVLADFTGGAKYHSIALYRAAERAQVPLCYIHRGGDQRRRLMLLAEPERG